MRALIRQPLRLPLLLLVSSVLALPATINIGYTSFDVTFAPNVGQVDIVNETGPNSSPAPDPTFPVTNSVSLTGLKLVVNFKTGPAQTFTSGYFTLDPDGLSFDGNPSFNIALDPVTSAVLTGTFSTTSLTLNDGTSATINPTFSATITDPGGSLQDGDFAVIEATTAATGGGSTSPEPASWLLLFCGLPFLLAARKCCFKRARLGKATSAFAIVAIASLLVTSSIQASTPDKVKLSTDTSPSSGVAGSTDLSISGTGFPAAPIPPADVTVTLAATCGGPAVATTTPLKVTSIIGSSEKIEFLVPGILTSGAYFVSVSGTSAAGIAFVSSNCSAVQVTKTAPVFGSCNPGSSMGLLAPAPVVGAVVPVTAYVPNASWDYAYKTGVQAVPLEGGGAATSIATADYINSCSTNSVTGVTVCTANGVSAQVYLLAGTKVTTTVASASNSQASFSGGYCYNCGVAVNSVTNQAVITMGYSTAPSGTALQFLDLGTNTFGTVVPAANQVSEDVLWDPFSNQVLSPNEAVYSGTPGYDVFQISGSGTPGAATVTEYGKALTFNYPDSAGEDCSTHIAITGGEDSGNIFLADLTQAIYTAGAPGSWTAPSAVYSEPEFFNLSAGASAIAMAPGSTHLGVVAGEFGGNLIGIIQLPATSGKGTPVIVDYVVATLPATPDGNAFANGYDPHTTTAYTSPNNQKAYGVAASWASAPTYVGVIDLAAALAAPRSGAHTISPTVNLLATGIVHYYKATP